MKLDFNRSSKPPHRSGILLNAVENYGVALVEVFTDSGKIEAAIDEPVAVRAPLVFPLHQAHR
jgi:hypothetical protein